MATDLWRHWCISMADSIKSENWVRHQIFNVFMSWNSFNNNLSFSQTSFPKSLNSGLISPRTGGQIVVALLLMRLLGHFTCTYPSCVTVVTLLAELATLPFVNPPTFRMWRIQCAIIISKMRASQTIAATTSLPSVVHVVQYTGGTGRCSAAAV